MAGKVAVARRTQEERSSAMRQRLLDATIACLVEHGYAGTTTTRVAEIAGVTRGAQVHHFPTRADLVTAAVRHLATKRVDEAFTHVDRLRGTEDPIAAGLDLMWQMHQGPVFIATVELWVAARADPELRSQIASVETLVTGSLVEFGTQLYPEIAGYPEFRRFVYTAMDTVRGILLSSFVTDDSTMDQRWQRAREHLRVVADAIVRDHPGSTAG